MTLRRIAPISHNYPTVEAWGAYLTLNLIYRPLAAYYPGAIPPRSKPELVELAGTTWFHPVRRAYTTRTKPTDRSHVRGYFAQHTGPALARLLMLDTPLPNQSSLFFGSFHSNTNAKFDPSPLPALYRSLNRQSIPSKIAATLVIAWYLQINDIVEHILKLSLTMKGSSVTVHFEGKRNTQYQNEDQQHNIKIDGTCDLTQGVSASPVKLTSYLPYR